MELPVDKNKLQLEITNWPKGSRWQIFTILVALLGYGVTWYLDRQTRLEQIHDQKIQFERQELQDSINRKMVAYEKVETAISNIRRIWYIARAKCAFDTSYATDPQKIEAVNLERWNARIDLMRASYGLDIVFKKNVLKTKIWDFNTWERQTKNICAPNSPTEEEYIKEQVGITKILSDSIEQEQAKLTNVSTQD